MNDRQPPEFKIRLDDEPPETIFKKKPAKQATPKVKGPGRAWPIVTVLLFLTLGGALVFAYLDMKSRLDRIHNTGAQKTHNISQDLQSKFSSLSVKFASQEDAVTALNRALDEKTAAIEKKTTAAEKAITVLESDIKKVRTSLEKINTANTKLSKQIAAVSKVVNGVKVTVKPLQSGVKKNRAALAANHKKAMGEIQPLGKKMAAISNDISALKGTEKAYQERFTRLDNRIQQENRSGKDLEEAIGNLTTQLSALKKEVATIRAAQKKLARKPAPVISTPVPTATEPAPLPKPPPAKERSVPKPGELIEQDIH